MIKAKEVKIVKEVIRSDVLPVAMFSFTVLKTMLNLCFMKTAGTCRYPNPSWAIDPLHPPTPPQFSGLGEHEVTCCVESSKREPARK